MRASKSKRLRKKRAKARNRAREARAEERRQHAAATAHLRPTRMRRLLGLSSRGVDLKLHFDSTVEIPYDPDDPVGSVEHALEVSKPWRARGYPTRGET